MSAVAVTAVLPAAMPPAQTNAASDQPGGGFAKEFDAAQRAAEPRRGHDGDRADRTDAPRKQDDQRRPDRAHGQARADRKEAATKRTDEPEGQVDATEAATDASADGTSAETQPAADAAAGAAQAADVAAPVAQPTVGVTPLVTTVAALALAQTPTAPTGATTTDSVVPEGGSSGGQPSGTTQAVDAVGAVDAADTAQPAAQAAPAVDAATSATGRNSGAPGAAGMAAPSPTEPSPEGDPASPSGSSQEAAVPGARAHQGQTQQVASSQSQVAVALAQPVALAVATDPQPSAPVDTPAAARGIEGVAGLAGVQTPAAAPVDQTAVQRLQPVAPAPLAEQLSGQLTSIRQLPKGDHVMTLTVNPETFGPVRVVAHIAADGVSLELFGASDQARAALRQALPDLRRDLVGAGLDARLDVNADARGGFASNQQAQGQGQADGQRGGGFAAPQQPSAAQPVRQAAAPTTPSQRVVNGAIDLVL